MRSLASFLLGACRRCWCLFLPFHTPSLAQNQSDLRLLFVGSDGDGRYDAKDSGAFDKYGIQADVIFISSGPVVVQGIDRGRFARRKRSN